MHTPKIAQILKDSDYTLTLFSKDSIQNLEAKIITKNANGGGTIK